MFITHEIKALKDISDKHQLEYISEKENLTQRERIGFKTSREVGHGKKSSLTGTPEHQYK